MLDMGKNIYSIVPMYIEKIPNRDSPPATLLRECWREGKHIRKRTIANLSELPSYVIEMLQRALKGERLVSIKEVFRIERSYPHGHVVAVLTMIHRLGLEQLIATKRTRQRDLVVTMIVESNRSSRDPVAPAESSLSAKIKKARRHTSDGFPVHSFETLLQDLATQTKNICESPPFSFG